MYASHDTKRWFDAVVNISRRIANLEETTIILEVIVGLARELMSADVAAVALLNENKLVLQCHVTADGIQHISCDQINETIILQAVQQGQRIRFPSESGVGAELSWDCPVLQRPIRSAAIVPMTLDGTPFGALWVARHEPLPFPEHDFTGLTRLADQVVIALEHASMTSKLQSAAVAQERYRIAREMHDSLAQVLGYLNLQMQTLEALVSQGDLASLLAELATARRTICAAQDDVRESILSLRTTLSDDLPLLTALERYVEDFGVQTGIEVCFINQAQTPVHLSPLAETELVRIVQEALTNVRKHAAATRVQVRVITDDQTLHIQVADDGKGMDQQAINGSHFGLQTMRERATSIEGHITISSKPEQGTTVTLSVPLLVSTRNTNVTPYSDR